MIIRIQGYSPKMGQSLHFIKDLCSGHEGGGAANLRSDPGGRHCLWLRNCRLINNSSRSTTFTFSFTTAGRKKRSS